MLRTMLRLGLILMICGVVAAGGLALLNARTEPIIAAYKERQQAEAREQVIALAGGVKFDLVEGNPPFFKSYNETGELVGYVGVAYGAGYSSRIETVCGFDTTWNVTGIKIVFQQETPGLGTKVNEIRKGTDSPWFQSQFIGQNSAELAVTKDRGKIDSITGATISSRAVTNSVRDLAKGIRDQIQTESTDSVSTLASSKPASSSEIFAGEGEK